MKKKKQKKAKKENTKNDVRADMSFQCGRIGVVAKAAAAIRPTEAEPAKSERSSTSSSGMQRKISEKKQR